MKKTQKKLIAMGVVFVVAIIMMSLFVVGVGKRNRVDNESKLPKMDITLNNTSIEGVELDKDAKFPGNEVAVTFEGEKRNYSNVEIEGHGNSTWQCDKKPYKLKFKHKTGLLKLASVKEWILIANRYDNTQLRNDIAFYVSNMLNMQYAPKGEYMELTIDDDYRGLYYLVPKIEIGKNSVNLRSSTGVLVELDNLHGAEDSCYYSKEKMCLLMKDIVDKDNAEISMQYFVDNFNRLEAATRERDYESISEVIDIDSFVKYYLLSEFTVNPDSYTSSWFMYKDGLDDKIHAGPGWDFDFALGNRNWIWNNDEDFYSPDLDMVREVDALGGKFIFNGKIVEKEPNWTISRVMIRLMKTLEFKERVREVFAETMAGRKMELLNYIGRKADEIYPAILRDNGRWEEVNYWSEVNSLLDWVDKRYEHFEKTYGNEENEKVEYF